ncbi:ER membrane protein complex subunit 1 isoform X2 [Bradysia coprophila]|uniref:ER membrane protein complex subunit 1 isoform X2 n=1 Tax=Bradysia coprophila TaxID=38358 RepID=UPI00187D7FF9|nr:ER membrane protein complex subunit 1 isoform X2 [Bradysia coprophila]
MHLKSFSLKNSVLSVAIFLCFVRQSHELYEDQIGKFDWKQDFVGKVKNAFFDGDRIIVATEQNVLAALSVRTGSIQWRKVLEKDTRGSIQYLHVVQTNKNELTRSGEYSDYDVITVSGINPAMVRGWNPSTGNINWEWSLTPNTPVNGENSLWFYQDSILYHVVPVYGSHIEITGYYASSGQHVKSTTTRISAPWIVQGKCIMAVPYFACAIGSQLVGVNLLAESSVLVARDFDRDVSGSPLKLLKGVDATVIIGNEAYTLQADKVVLKSTTDAFNFNLKISNENILLSGALQDDKSIRMQSTYLDSGKAYNDLYMVANFPETFGLPEILDVQCKSKGSGPVACRMLLSSDNAALILMQQGKTKWVREEALANIVAIEMIDLPLADFEGSIESELQNKDGDIFGTLLRRISNQILQIRNLILTVVGLDAHRPDLATDVDLTRDAFGLHKMIVAVTEYGKIFGIDNMSGKYHWIKHLPNFSGFNEHQSLKIFVQRTSRHFPHPPMCSVIGKNKNNGNGILYQFNPISGQSINGGITTLDYKIQQVSLLHDTESDFLKAILILDQQNQVHVIPKESANLAHKMYLYTADKTKGTLSGFFINYANKQLDAIPIWEINLGGAGNIQKITNIAMKSSIEHVHSQGRVLNDRSVLYKYINPNLVAVATQGPDSIHKYVLNIHLVDVVSGAVVQSLTHRRAKGPIHMVHSENWLVYSYYNDKVRRTEITSVELYEGKTQANSTIWSSLDAPQMPMVEKQSYIVPASVVSLKETITEKGITNKHVLIALSNGGIIEMPWVLLDPRRPILLPNQGREEGVIPYIPELPLPSENVINYNQSVTAVKGIYTAPSGLESTCLVVVYGLDFFVTRIAPSKSFDLLKEDFDYILITVVLAALTISSCVAKHLSSRKTIKQAWK